MISVIVPVYNVEKYIVKCLESIVNQNYKDFELLLVNDGSKDNSINLALDYLKNKAITYQVINKENGGLASARNAGLKAAKGEYISFIDSDDYIAKDFIKELKESIDNNDVDFAFCNFEYVKEQKEPTNSNDKTNHMFKKEELLVSFLRRTISFVVPSMMFKKEFIEKNKLFFDEEIRFSEDQPFIWNVILHSDNSVYINKKMYGYYIRENSIMTSTKYEKIINSFNEYKNYITILFKNYPEYKEISNKILPRWELGALYTSAKLLSFDDYKNLYLHMDGKTILKRIKGIKERNAYLLAFVCFISPKLLYFLCRKLNLNE